MRKFLVFGIPLVLILGGVWIGWSTWNADDEPDLSWMIATAERRDIESSLLLTGEVAAAFQVDIKAEVGGKVRKLYVEAGDFVRKGEMLATIDESALLTEKASAETDIAGAELVKDKILGNYERAHALFEEKLVSKEVDANLKADLAIAKNTLAKAVSRLDIVKDRLDKTRIVAPADGTVLDLPVTEGQVVVAAASVNSGTVLMTFADLSHLLIESHVNQVDAPSLKKGMPVIVHMPDSAAAPVKAHIDFIAPLAVVKNNIKGFKVEAVIDENDGRLKPGMSVSMTVPVGHATDAVTVPVSAVFRDKKDDVVYVRKGQKTEKRKVSLGISNLSDVQIKSGVDAGEKVLLVEPASLPAAS